MHYLSDFKDCAGRPVNQRQIKEEKLKQLFDLLYAAGEMARADLARATGLSPTTVSALVEELIRRGIFVETGYAPAMQGGRRPIKLCVNAQGRQIPTFTLRGDGVRFELYNLGMEVLEAFDLRFSDGEVEHSDESCTRLIADILYRRSKCFSPQLAAGVCICIPGIYKPDHRAFMLDSGGELRLEVLEALERELHMPLFLGNELHCLTYMEAMRSEETESDGLIYVNVSRQVEACLYVNGDVYTGRDNYAGQLGHVSINYRGRACSCGSRGCLERYVNIDAVLERIAEAAAFKRCWTLEQLTGGDMGRLTVEMIGRAYEAGEPVVVEVIDDIAEQLFAGVYAMVSITGVGRIALGGDIARMGPRFLERMQALAGQTNGHHLLRGITITYSDLDSDAVSSGLVSYFIKKRFEINRG